MLTQFIKTRQVIILLVQSMVVHLNAMFQKKN